MNLQKISLPEIHGSSNKTFTILECLPGHLHHLGFLHNPPPGSPDIFTIHLHHLGMSPRTSAPSRMSSQSTPSSSDISSAVSAIYLPAHIGAPTSTSHGTKSSNALVQFTWQWIPFHRYLWVWFRVQVPSFWRHLAAGVLPCMPVAAY